MAPTIVTFTGADGSCEPAYSSFDTSGTCFRIASNRGRDDNGTAYQGYHTGLGLLGPGDTDVSVQITTLPSGGSGGFVMVCCDVQTGTPRTGLPLSTGSNQSHIGARYHDSVGPGVQLYYYNATGSDFHVFATDTSWSWVNGDWLRLTRVVDALKSWASHDGLAWTQLSSATMTAWTDHTGGVGLGISDTSPRVDDWTWTPADTTPQNQLAWIKA